MPDTINQGDGKGSRVPHQRGATTLEVQPNPPGTGAVATYLFGGENSDVIEDFGGVARLYYSCCRRGDESGEY
jgi:hypothetical protein